MNEQEMKKLQELHPLTTPQSPEERAKNIKIAQDVLIKTDSVILDVERTIIREHCVHQLALFVGKPDEVEQRVDKYAKDVHEINLQLEAIFKDLQLTREDIAMFCKTFPYTFVPGIEAFVAHLHSKGVAVYLATEGIAELVYPIAKKLNIPNVRVYGAPLDYSKTPVMPDFTETTYKIFSPHGKSTLVRRMKVPLDHEGIGPRHKHVVFIGDAYNDAFTIQFSDAVIGYTGVHRLEDCVNICHWPVDSFEELHQFHKANSKGIDGYPPEERHRTRPL